MRRLAFISSLAAIVVLAAAPLPALAAQPPGAGPNVQVITQTIPLSQKACQTMAAADPKDAATILNNCYMTVTSTFYPLVTQRPAAGTQSSAGQAQTQDASAAASSCSWYGYGKGDVRANSLGFSADLATIYDVNTCNQVRLESATCNYMWIWPWSITQTFCGVLPSSSYYYNYTQNYVALNYIASTAAGGSTCTLSYGMNPTHKPTMSYYNLIETC